MESQRGFTLIELLVVVAVFHNNITMFGYADGHAARKTWEELQSLPNLIYTDGNDFSLWHGDDLVTLIRLHGDIETSENQLDGPPEIVKLFSEFLPWEPEPLRDAKQLYFLYVLGVLQRSRDGGNRSGNDSENRLSEPMQGDRMRANPGVVQLEEKGGMHVCTKRLHVDRTPGGNCHHRIAHGDIDARLAAGEKASAGSQVPVIP